ncbi:MAG: hypothetical protein NT094_02145, partial [Candidatus Staskawiczbacteria bacterium]|nr:hypothetical protein [Candidatus Staskawiczbacteria bacterium]
RILNPNNTPAGLNAMNQRVAYAQSFGHEKSEFEKKDYRLKEFNDKDTDQALTAMGHKTAINSQLTFDGINPATATAEQRVAAAKKIPTAPGLVDAELTRRGIAPATASAADRTAAETEVSVLGKARRRAILTQLKTNLPQMSGNELRNISFDHLSSAANPENYNFVRENLTPHMIDQFSTADPLKIAALQGHSHQLRRDIAAARGSGNMNEANRLRKLREAISRLP